MGKIFYSSLNRGTANLGGGILAMAKGKAACHYSWFLDRFLLCASLKIIFLQHFTCSLAWGFQAEWCFLLNTNWGAILFLSCSCWGCFSGPGTNLGLQHLLLGFTQGVKVLMSSPFCWYRAFSSSAKVVLTLAAVLFLCSLSWNDLRHQDNNRGQPGQSALDGIQLLHQVAQGTVTCSRGKIGTCQTLYCWNLIWQRQGVFT